MQKQTAIDVLVDAGAVVGSASTAAIGAEFGRTSDDRPPADSSDRSARRKRTRDGDGRFETLLVGTLLVLAVGQIPAVGVLLVGYVVASARSSTAVLAGFDDWRRIGLDGARGTALALLAALPAGALLVGIRRVGGEGSIAAGRAPAPGTLLALLAVAFLAIGAWHGFVAGLVALAGGTDRNERTATAWVRLARSPAVRRLSIALGGWGVAVGAVRFGLGGVPVVGPGLAAGATFFGVAVTACAVRRIVAVEARRHDRLATTIAPERPVGRRRERAVGARSTTAGFREARHGEKTGE